MRKPIVLDLETKHTFRTHPKTEDLGISVVGIYDYATDRLKGYVESELSTLFPILERASIIIGYNIDHFDMRVLSVYYPGDIKKLPTFDILADIKEKLGRRLSLNDMVNATLDKKKSGHGLQAIELYKEGQIDKLIQYCLDDVDLTRELFEYGIKNKEVSYLNHVGKAKLSVSWNKYMDYQGDDNDLSLTLPF